MIGMNRIAMLLTDRATGVLAGAVAGAALVFVSFGVSGQVGGGNQAFNGNELHRVVAQFDRPGAPGMTSNYKVQLIKGAMKDPMKGPAITPQLPESSYATPTNALYVCKNYPTCNSVMNDFALIPNVAFYIIGTKNPLPNTPTPPEPPYCYYVNGQYVCG